MCLKKFCVPALLAVILVLQPDASALAATTIQSGKPDSSEREQQADAGASIAELEALVSSLDEQVAQLQALSGEAQELGQALEQAWAAAAAEGAEGAPASESTVGEGLKALDGLIVILRESIEALKTQSAAARASIDEALLAPAGPAPVR